jgi:hypothetical protein
MKRTAIFTLLMSSLLVLGLWAQRAQAQEEGEPRVQSSSQFTIHYSYRRVS